MAAQGDFVYWEKKAKWVIKNWISALPGLCCLFDTHPGSAVIKETWNSLSVFIFCTWNGQDSSLHHCLRGSKNICGPSANTISKHFRGTVPSGSCCRWGAPEHSSSSRLLSSFSAQNCLTKGWELYFGGALYFFDLPWWVFYWYTVWWNNSSGNLLAFMKLPQELCSLF